MSKLNTIHCLLMFIFAISTPAMSATFSVKDISGQQECTPFSQFQAPKSTAAQCSTHPQGTVKVDITPDAGEFPTACYGFDSGKFCSYAANIYVTARYQSNWYSKLGYTWLKTDIASLAPAVAWPIWSGIGTASYILNVGELNLTTGKFDPPLSGIEVYVGLAPSSGPVFSPNTVAKIYPIEK